MGRVTCISITRAVRDCELEGLSITAGQAIGLVNEKLAVSADTPEACIGLLSEQFASSASVTVFYGEAVDEAALDGVYAELNSSLADDCELITVNGGQSVYEYIIAVE